MENTGKTRQTVPCGKEGLFVEKTEKKKVTVYYVTLVAVFAALVFVSNWLYIPIPVAVGNMSRITLGNVFVLLCGFILGSVGGGLAGGIGAALFDVMNPAYIASAPFTFAFRFLQAGSCGLLSHAGGRESGDTKRNIVAAVVGSVVYIVLYLAKSFITGMLEGSETETVLIAVGTKAVTSGINGLVAVICSVPLCAAIRLAIKKSGLQAKL